MDAVERTQVEDDGDRVSLAALFDQVNSEAGGEVGLAEPGVSEDHQTAPGRALEGGGKVRDGARWCGRVRLGLKPGGTCRPSGRYGRRRVLRVWVFELVACAVGELSAKVEVGGLLGRRVMSGVPIRDQVA